MPRLRNPLAIRHLLGADVTVTPMETFDHSDQANEPRWTTRLRGDGAGRSSTTAPVAGLAAWVSLGWLAQRNARCPAKT